jgi:DNA-binding transcriptional regulator of glucitol operon
MGAGRSQKTRDVALIALTAVLVPSFLALGYWQLMRALSGNSLSWAYVFEWPLFAGYLVYVCRRLLREPRPAALAPGGGGAASGDGAGPAREDAEEEDAEEEEDEELAAYNRYLAALEESGRRKRW